MNNTNQRVADCFANVFPDIQADEIPRASTASLAAWDSVAHVTLLSALSEEFEIEFAPDDFEELVSFQLILDYVQTRKAHD
jgi:acyl carrier protein